MSDILHILLTETELYEYLDFDRTLKAGHFAFQLHDLGSYVNIRKVEVLPLDD